MAGFGDEIAMWRGPSGVTDVSGNGHNATYVGSMGVVADSTYNGVSAFDFNGTNQCMTVPSAVALRVTPTMTLAFWYLIDTTPGAFAGIAGMWDPPSTQRGYSAYLSSTSLVASVSDDGTNNVGHRSGCTETSTPTGSWQFVVFEFNAGPISGLRNNTTAIPNSTDEITTIHASTAQFILGAQSNSGTPYRFFDGRMDDIRLFDRVLTSQEKTDWWTAGRGYDVSSGVSIPIAAYHYNHNCGSRL